MRVIAQILFILLAYVPASLGSPSCQNLLQHVSTRPLGTDVLYGQTVKTAWLCSGNAECVVIVDSPIRYSRTETLEVLPHDFFDDGGSFRDDIDAGAMNCHAYGCHANNVPGIDKRIWLNAHKASRPYDRDHYYEGLLKNYFNLKASYHFPEILKIDARAVEKGDVIVFVANDVILHTGIVVEEVGQSHLGAMIQSKLGASPVADARLDRVAKLYRADELRIYRRK